jgi:hypothetical protein
MPDIDDLPRRQVMIVGQIFSSLNIHATTVPPVQRVPLLFYATMFHGCVALILDETVLHTYSPIDNYTCHYPMFKHIHPSTIIIIPCSKLYRHTTTTTHDYYKMRMKNPMNTIVT